MSAPNWISTVTMQSVATAERTTKYMRQMADRINAGRSTSQKRIGALIVALFLSAGVAFAQGTIMPAPVFTGLDTNGNPLVSGKLCTYQAGTSTPATTYTTSALDPLTAHTNPIILDGAGRAIVFLRPGSSYKFVLYSAGSDQTCSTGTLQWSSDNISALPSSNVNLDIDGTAGESLTAGDAVYLSDGTGGRTQGSWYKTDADLTYASTNATALGMVPSAIASGSTGTVRTAGVVTVTGPLTVGPYYVGTTAGAIVATPPTNAIRLGTANSATSIIVGYAQAPVSPRGPPCGRLTLTSGLPVTVSNVTAATTIYYTPAGSCNTISLYDGTAWRENAFAELSIAVPATTNTMYDVFAYDNAGVVALELTAWTNDTTRATALVLQNGVYSKTGALTRRYLGSFRTTGVSGQTESSLTTRYVANYDNCVPMPLEVTDANASWTYTTATVRQARGSAANQVNVVVGVQGVNTLTLDLLATGINDGGAQQSAGIGEDSTTTYASGAWWSGSSAVTMPAHARLDKQPTVGRHFYSWNEWSTAAGTSTWYGTNTIGGSVASGLRGSICQ